MDGETNLNILLASMKATLAEVTYVFVTSKAQTVPDSLSPRMVFQEAEGTTYIVEKAAADAAGLAYEYPCRMITLEVHSSLEAVGFIARIASELASANMSVNPVSGYFHDHLFSPEERAMQAMAIIRQIALEA